MSQSPSEVVHYDVTNELATITLDSPRNRNALSRQLVRELAEHLESAYLDAAVKVVLIRSSGRVFCSGADLSEAIEDGMVQGARRLVDLQRLILALDKPVVVQVDGPARAGGIGIIAAADVAIAAERANFALTEVKLGLAPSVISLTVFHRMSARAASFVALGGEVFGAAEAVQFGLVTMAVPTTDMEGAVAAACRSLVSGAAQGLAETKRLLNRELLEKFDTFGDQLADLSAGLFDSDAAREAMAGFLNR